MSACAASAPRATLAVVKDAVTGCRPDQLFGLWAIEETRFARMVDLVRGVDLEKLRAESQAAADKAAGRPLYQLRQDGIALIEVSGPMTKYPTSLQALLGGTSTLRTRDALRAAARDPEVLGVMLVIDSPGGTVSGSFDLGEDVAKVAERKPVHAYAWDLMASAALLAGVGARKVWANTNAEVGSIGVYSVVEDTSGVYDKAGVKVHVISSAPPIKGAGVDGTQVTPEQLAEWKRRVDDLAQLFVADVAKRRRMPKEKAQALATGQVWVADKARELGLIDGVLSLDDAIARLRSEAMAEQEAAAALAMAAEAEQKMEAEKAGREKAERELADMKTRLKGLEDEKRRGRFAADAAAVGAPADFGPVLDAIEGAAGSAVYEKLLTQFRAYQAQVATGALFIEKGTAGASAGESDFEAAARAKVASGAAKTLTEAYRMVSKENPKAYEEHAERVRKGAA
jgi:signal peptide peptidase SppA